MWFFHFMPTLKDMSVYSSIVVALCIKDIRQKVQKELTLNILKFSETHAHG